MSDALRNTIKASFARNKIYSGKPSYIKRRELHDALKSELQKISAQHDRAISEEQHCKNILQLAETITKQFGPIIRESRFNIGTAQKSLNLYLKFQWCLGRQKLPPPHCPIDSKILKKSGIYEPWTKIDSIKTYKDWIERVKVIASQKPLAEWELNTWKRVGT
ncbi:MAG TPA: hypothetical protein VGY56_06725 [Verrucomicrobiae bacterium]|nr:hypothetical protein [Verrucomicrobiae bacterium]